MFISPAFAQTASDVAAPAAAADGAGFLMSMLPLLLIFFVFYLMVIRPQNKRIMEHRQMINNLQKGDKVITGGGIVATVKKLSGDEEVVLEIADGVDVTVMRHTLMMLKNPKQKQAGQK